MKLKKMEPKAAKEFLDKHPIDEDPSDVQRRVESRERMQDGEILILYWKLTEHKREIAPEAKEFYDQLAIKGVKRLMSVIVPTWKLTDEEVCVMLDLPSSRWVEWKSGALKRVPLRHRPHLGRVLCIYEAIPLLYGNSNVLNEVIRTPNNKFAVQSMTFTNSTKGRDEIEEKKEEPPSALDVMRGGVGGVERVYNYYMGELHN